MSLERPGSYEKGHLMYHTDKQVFIERSKYELCSSRVSK